MRNDTFEPTAISAPGTICTDSSDGLATLRLALSALISAGVGGSFTSTGGRLIISKGDPPGALATGDVGLGAAGFGAGAGGAITTGVGSDVGGMRGGSEGVAVGAGPGTS